MAETRDQRGRIVGINLRGAGDGDIGEAGVKQVRVYADVGIDQDSFRGEPLRAGRNGDAFWNRSLFPGYCRGVQRCGHPALRIRWWQGRGSRRQATCPER
jgi:hypothetical protein